MAGKYKDFKFTNGEVVECIVIEQAKGETDVDFNERLNRLNSTIAHWVCKEGNEWWTYDYGISAPGWMQFIHRITGDTGPMNMSECKGRSDNELPPHVEMINLIGAM